MMPDAIRRQLSVHCLARTKRETSTFHQQVRWRVHEMVRGATPTTPFSPKQGTSEL